MQSIKSRLAHLEQIKAQNKCVGFIYLQENGWLAEYRSWKQMFPDLEEAKKHLSRRTDAIIIFDV